MAALRSNIYWLCCSHLSQSWQQLLRSRLISCCHSYYLWLQTFRRKCPTWSVIVVRQKSRPAVIRRQFKQTLCFNLSQMISASLQHPPTSVTSVRSPPTVQSVGATSWWNFIFQLRTNNQRSTWAADSWSALSLILMQLIMETLHHL